MKISADYYEFLLEIGVPYEGYVEGVGEVINMPVITGSSTAADGSRMGQGATYLSVNYAAVIIPNRDEEIKIAAEQVSNEFIKLTADGYMVQDINTNRWENFGHHISKNEEIVDGHVTITVTGDKGRPYTYIIDTKSKKISGGYNRGNNTGTFDGRKVYEAFDSGFDFMEHKFVAPHRKGRLTPFNGIKRNTQVKHTYDAMKWAKSKGIKIKTKPSVFVDKTLPRVLKRASRVVNAVAIFVILHDVYKDRAFKTSHSLDAVMFGVSFIPYCGWAISAGYFIIDTGVDLITDKSFGDRLDEWAEEEFGLEDGVLLDIRPAFDWANETIDDIFSTTFSF